MKKTTLKTTLRERIFSFLKEHPEKRFTAREIAKALIQADIEYFEQKRESSIQAGVRDDDAALLQQVVGEIGSRRTDMERKHPEFKTTEERPRQFYYSQKSDKEEVKTAEKGESTSLKKTGKESPKEKALYRPLCQFLYREQGIYPMRINESHKKGGGEKGTNKWLHPDVVAMEVLGKDWERVISECVKHNADKKVRLWSFEVKILINRSNVREVFFQTVSNSSWANYAYLVAETIEGIGTLKELRMLGSLHGVGLIRLNKDEPTESDVLIPARKMEVDWDAASRLAKENKDFCLYIEKINDFHKLGKTDKRNWDGTEGDIED